MSNIISKKVYKRLKKEKKEIDWLMWFVGFLGPIVTVPQVALVYINQSVENISYITWGMYLFIGVVMCTYGFIHRIRPLFYGQLAWIIVYFFMILGIVIYD